MNEVVKIAAVGDIALSHGYDAQLVSEGYLFPFEKARSFFNDHDIVIANLEAPFCKTGKTYPLKCSLKADPEYLKGLSAVGIDVVSLANNHILDYREEAFYKTRELLDTNNIRHFGSGANLSEARMPAVCNVKDISIGFLGYCDVQIDSPFYASENERGISPFKLEYIKEDIGKLSKLVDIVIVSLHWGMENWSYPTPQQREQAYRIIDYGADLIIGHHPHVLQGVEQYKQGYIIYSLGNFLFSEIEWSWTNDNGDVIHSKVELGKENRETLLLSVTVDVEGIKRIEYQPGFIDINGQAVLLNKGHRIRKRFDKISKDLEISDYERFWKRYEKKKRMFGKMKSGLKRLKRIHKVRPKHIEELIRIISK